jgi:hypothetical protein
MDHQELGMPSSREAWGSGREPHRPGGDRVRDAEGSSGGVASAASLAAVLVALLCAVPGCADEETVLLLEVWSQGQISELHVSVKEFLDEQRAIVYSPQVVPIPDSSDYLIDQPIEPLKIRLGLPGSGRYAVHLAGFPEGLDPATFEPETQDWTVYTATICHEIRGPLFDQQVYLGLITEALDADFDTFPEDSAAYCEARSLAHLPCNMDCNTPEYLALLDCNPAPDLTWPEGCPEVLANAEWNPFVRDQCANCFDEDCYGGDAPCEDRDGDGVPGNMDCNDDDPEIHPGADEICGNGIDENCVIDLEGCDDGDRPCDLDGDGSPGRVPRTNCGSDCDDANPDINPRALEGCVQDAEGVRHCYGCGEDLSGDGLDNNCNGRIDEGCFEQDVDNDGVPYLDAETMTVVDCNDCNSAVGPGFPTVCGNVVDEDCDGRDETCNPNDRDRDGFVDISLGGTDCDDGDPHTFSGAPDLCGDGIAQDCGHDWTCDTDADGDGYLADDGDCNDSVTGIHPWAPELCDELGVDEDCDDQVNEVEDLVEPFAEPSTGCGFNPTSGFWYEIDFISDLSIRHCGSCHHECCPTDFQCEGNTCVGGSCDCYGRGTCGGVVTNTCCPDGCQNQGTDTRNCGGCGVLDSEFICVRNETCNANPENEGLGECVCPYTGTRCPYGAAWSVCCPAGCVNVWEDPRNCNDCSDDCTLTRSGEAGPRGELCAVINPEDPVARCYCGAVGVQCGGNDWCTNVTEPLRDPPRPMCGCADLRFDPNNCDECGHRCDPNELCDDRACQCHGAGGSLENCRGGETHYCCPGFGCVDRMTRTDHCGECGRRCNVGEVCVDGVCQCGSCDDGNPCTTDSCNADDRCEYHTLDADGDGHCGRLPDGTQCRATEPLTPGTDCDDSPGDCDDSRSDVYPGSTERCGTAYDDDCDGDVNDLNASACITRYRDSDRDGYYPAGAPSECRCAAAGNFDSTRGGDCDDAQRLANPSVAETCATTYDDDCDGDTNDLNATSCTTYYRDSDGDGFYPAGAPTECHCRPSGAFSSTTGGDCDDSNRDANPSETETCDTGFDDDCDGSNNDLDARSCTTRYRDADRDTYYPAGAPSECRCTAVGAFDSTRSGDCDDANADRNPGETEDCATGIDDDCDSLTNEQGAAHCSTFYFDSDGDTYGTAASQCWCAANGNYRAARSGDCDDANAAANPGATETCATAFDDDCDGDNNEIGVAGCVTRYTDSDRDGYYPTGAASECRCTGVAPRTATLSGDCDDANAARNPGATETCATAYDDDCDSDVNDVGATGCTTRYTDSDGDGYYPAGASSECRCTGVAPRTATLSGDCDDTNADRNPGATEDCGTGFDDDCDTDTNDVGATGCTTRYHDGDRDGYYPAGAASECRCSGVAPRTATLSGDCLDSNAAVNPGAASDPCDGLNNDCDATTDEDAACTGGTPNCCGTAGCRECCDDDHCGGTRNPDCNMAAYTCFCRAAGAECGAGQTCGATGCTP